jgi:muramoyltetrapeptide carboxypeptidase
MTFPKPLKKGDTIGVVSPGGFSDIALLEKGKALLEKRGYRVFIHPQNYLQNGKLAGSDEARAAALMDMFTDPTIDAISCARGGAGAMRLLDRLDYKKIKKNPKIFVGYSDVTFLLQTITARCSFVTYHGPMLSGFGRVYDARTLDDFFAVLESKRGTFKLTVPDAETFVAGKAEGMLVGGSIGMLQAMIGTPYDWSAKNAILFIEDCNEHMYRFDRVMTQLRLANRLKNVRAVIVGEMINLWNNEADGEPPYLNLKQILQDHLPSGIPVCINFPCGHGKYITTLPVGAKAKLNFGKKGVELSFTRA